MWPSYPQRTMARMTANVCASYMLICTALAASHATGSWESFIQNSRRAVLEDCSTLQSLGWLREYTRWHAEQLKHPENAKFLLYTCGPPNWEGAGSSNATTDSFNGCAGMGDRLRGMVEMLRQAAYSNRVLLLHWTHPFSLERAFEPTGIDWRVKQEYKLNVTYAPYVFDEYMTKPLDMTSGAWKDQHQAARVVIMRITSEDHGGVIYNYWPNFGHGNSDERACAYQALFKPSQAVEKKAVDMLQSLLGTATQPYVAAHLRLGGFQGENFNVQRFEHLKGMLASLVCVRALAGATNSTKLPVLVITDNELLRSLIAAHYFEGVTGPAADVLPAHLDGARDASEDRLMSSFVDVVLLSRAAGLLRSPSGFSDIALRLGHSQYTTDVPACMEFLRNNPSEKPAGWLQHAVALPANTP